MPNEIPLPENLLHLIEKRDGKERRNSNSDDAQSQPENSQANSEFKPRQKQRRKS